MISTRLGQWQSYGKWRGVMPCRRSIDEIRGGDAAYNAAIAEEILRGSSGAAREIVLLNAAATIYVAGRADNLAAGVEAARRSIDEGAALERLEVLRKATGVARA